MLIICTIFLLFHCIAAASSQPCPAPSTCPCPCPQPSGNSLYLRPLPKTDNGPISHCPALCICLCIGGLSPPGVPLLPPKTNITAPNPEVASPQPSRLPTTLLPSTSSVSKATTSVSTTLSSMGVNTVTCPGIAGTNKLRSVTVILAYRVVEIRFSFFFYNKVILFVHLMLLINSISYDLCFQVVLHVPWSLLPEQVRVF